MRHWNGHPAWPPPDLFSILIEQTRMLERIDGRTERQDEKLEALSERVAHLERGKLGWLSVVPWKELAPAAWGIGLVAAVALGKLSWEQAHALLPGH